MAPPEEFRLEQVLQHTMRREEQEQVALSAVSREEQRQRERLERMRERLARQLRFVAEQTARSALDPAGAESAQRYLGTLEDSIDAQADIVSQMESRVLESRDQLVDTLKEKQSLEHLKQQQLAREAIEAARREAKAMDDITSARFARRESGAG